ncbi:MAG: nucleoside triphosphate pyrophosphohydrolase [Bacteroidetes bacterium]|nr:MAG: nucleoside triphosphate pyrophosphohydrolase [Bacteroidota bacterium]
MAHTRQEKMEAFGRLLDIMDDLRAGCPWDRKQTMETLRPLTIEETYELGDAILDQDLPEVKNEIGDILLHMVFYAKIGEEKEAFDMADVLESIAEKLIHRHPHIYGDTVAEDEETVKANWESLKLKEGKKSVLEGVPKSLPAMVKATRIQEKARGAGFDWDESSQVLAKMEEELAELKAEIAAKDAKKMENEFGDLLFSMINVARFLKIDPESALERTNKKFIKRFQFMEDQAKKADKALADYSLIELEVFWQAAKGEE